MKEIIKEYYNKIILKHKNTLGLSFITKMINYISKNEYVLKIILK